MKIYTEEQVKSAFRIGLRENYINQQDVENFANKGIKYLAPIELPSDEEIEEEGWDYDVMSGMGDSSYIHFIKGAKWVLDKIKNQQR